MSFTDRENTILIGTGSLLTGSLRKVSEEPNITNEGWDGLQVTYYQRRASCTPEQCADLFPTGARLGPRNWWITGVKPVEVAPGFWKFLVDFKGWAEEKPLIVKVGASADQQSGTSVRAPRYPGDTVGAVFAKVETHENMPTISISYLTDNIGTDSLTASVGKALAPPVLTGIDVPATVWDFLTVYAYHWPNGWCLMGSDQDRLPGTTAAYVTDVYKFIRDKTPG